MASVQCIHLILNSTPVPLDFFPQNRYMKLFSRLSLFLQKDSVYFQQNWTLKVSHIENNEDYYDLLHV